MVQKFKEVNHLWLHKYLEDASWWYLWSHSNTILLVKKWEKLSIECLHRHIAGVGHVSWHILIQQTLIKCLLCSQHWENLVIHARHGLYAHRTLTNPVRDSQTRHWQTCFWKEPDTYFRLCWSHTVSVAFFF